MEKRRPWFLDRYNDKNITFFFKYLWGYGALIYGIICISASITGVSDEIELVGEHVYFFIFSIYFFIMGIGLLSRKEWGRKLIIAFPFAVIILGIALLVVPETKSWGLVNTIIITSILTFILIFVIILYFIFGKKYYNHPNVRKYFSG